MLHELRVRDLAILEDVSVRFDAGLNVLTGETGAGKSILLKAMALLLGARADADLVRAGRPSAEVEARFERDPRVDALLVELDIDAGEGEDGLVVRRVVTAQGRSRAYIAGAAVPVTALHRLGTELVDYGSQHEHQVLLDEHHHLQILDRFGGLESEVAAVGEACARLSTLLAERTRLEQQEEKARAREDWLRFQLDELDRVAPEEGEDQKLEHERGVLRNAEKLATKARQAEDALHGGSGCAVDRLSEAARRLEELVAIDDALAPSRERLESALDTAREVGREVAAYARKRRSDPARLDEVEERLSTLRSLARKHRTDHVGVLKLRDGIVKELDELGHLEERIAGLAPSIEGARAEVRRLCVDLRAARDGVRGRLEQRVEEELRSLAMPRARFLCIARPHEGGEGRLDVGEGIFASADGSEAQVFQLMSNPGEPARPLAKVASGGELSRILLAIRRALSDASTVQCCVFDEVDAGLGGPTGEAVARKLKEVGRTTQVLCITHLPVIAAAADHHLAVEKVVDGGRTRTRVRALAGQERLDEVARMLGGEAVAAATFASALIASGGTGDAAFTAGVAP